jgi:DNA-binding transcriptional ArsR family regulator
MDGSFASKASYQLDAVSQPSRLLILGILAEGETYVGDLQKLLGLAQQSVSHHLVLLRLRGLVDCRRKGKRNYWSIADEGRRLLAVAREMVA